MDDKTTLKTSPGNAGQVREWDGEHGAYWAARAETYDASVAGYQPALLTAVAAQPGERILEVGCGSGQLALDLLRSIPGCTALGVDLSGAQLGVARQRAGELAAEFVQADAQVHAFDAASFDVVVSRTGTMFFSDPVAAFTNLARATRPGGRLVLLVWRGIEDNEWLREFLGAISRVRPLTPPSPEAPGPLAQSDPDRVREVLAAAGWIEVALAAHDELMWFGPDASGATSFIVGQMAGLLNGLDPGSREQAVSHLNDVMVAHAGPGGVRLGSGAWVISARRGPGAWTS